MRIRRTNGSGDDDDNHLSSKQTINTLLDIFCSTEIVIAVSSLCNVWC